MSIVHVAFYPSDWIGGTAKLSAEERGVYITLVAHMYEMAGPIERDDGRLCRMCGSRNVASFRKALEYLIDQGKITVTDDGLFNDRAEKEIKNATGKSEKARAAADRRWQKKPNKNNGSTNANASSKHMPQSCYPESEVREEDKSSSTKKRKSRMPEDAVISAKQKEAAHKRGLSDQEAVAQFQRFKNDALAKGKSFVNWDRAFVSWLDSPYFRPITTINGGHYAKPSQSTEKLRAFISGAD